MSIRGIYITGLLFLFCTLCLAEEIEPIERWAVKDFWGQLEAKMTEQQAVEILGSPQYVEQVNSSRLWYYSELPQFQDDQIISRPTTGFLRFKQFPAGFVLAQWKEPDWAVVTPHTEQEYLRVLQQIETEYARQQALQERQLQAEQREKIRAEKIAAWEQQKLQQQQQQQQSRQQQAEPPAQSPPKPQQQRIRSENQPDETPTKNTALTVEQKSSRFLIYGGIFIFVMALIISVLQGARYLGRR